MKIQVVVSWDMTP